ncbi:MAG: YhcH/YjgK/YiaL family protein [Kiritimatiellae bacterium]|nr:YhcH/YjgK/YiaL family protein [Kiritimatiellia bacterium]
MWLGKAERIQECGPSELAGKFAVVRNHFLGADWSTITDGRHDLAEGVYLLVSRPTGRGPSGARLEVHDRYIDVQFALEGRDGVGWKNRSDCRHPAPPEPPENDIAFFDDKPIAWAPLEGDTAGVFWPGDAHAPLGGEGIMRKAVYKVPVK